MALIVGGRPEDRRRIEQWLRQICGSIAVSAETGEATVSAQRSTTYATGCDSLVQMVASTRRVEVLPVMNPLLPLVQLGGLSLADLTGGATSAGPGQFVRADGRVGVGSDAYVYIDVTDRNGRGYGPPMWRILAHELTTGHAHHAIHGTHGRAPGERERQARQSENRHAAAHGLPPRRL